MGVKVRQKKPGGAYWIFVSEKGRRWSKKIGDEESARNAAKKVQHHLAMKWADDFVDSPWLKRKDLRGILVECPDCHTKMSIRNAACPKCGHPVGGLMKNGSAKYWIDYRSNGKQIRETVKPPLNPCSVEDAKSLYELKTTETLMLTTERLKVSKRLRDGQRLFDLKDAAFILGRSVYSLRTLIWNGSLPVIREGKKMWIDYQDLNQWISRSRETVRQNQHNENIKDDVTHKSCLPIYKVTTADVVACLTMMGGISSSQNDLINLVVKKCDCAKKTASDAIRRTVAEHKIVSHKYEHCLTFQLPEINQMVPLKTPTKTTQIKKDNQDTDNEAVKALQVLGGVSYSRNGLALTMENLFGIQRSDAITAIAKAVEMGHIISDVSQSHNEGCDVYRIPEKESSFNVAFSDETVKYLKEKGGKTDKEIGEMQKHGIGYLFKKLGKETFNEVHIH